MNQFKSIHIEVADYIATITINRPDSLNALSIGVVNDLHEAFSILKNEIKNKIHALEIEIK